MLSAKISIISLENSALAISFGKIIEICTEIILNSMREKPIIQVRKMSNYLILMLLRKNRKGIWDTRVGGANIHYRFYSYD